MKNDTIRKVAIEIFAFLFILLFAYAAFAKLVDYEKFRVQLGQSPLLTAFAGWVAWCIPVVELIVCVKLATPRLRLIGFYSFYGMMVMFTAYIIAILQFSDYIPCSCGGVLKDLSWGQHLVFNISFIVLAMAAIMLYSWKDNKKTVVT